MALEPSGVPSRAEIQAAIDAAVPKSVRRNSVVTTDGSGVAYFAFGTTFDAPPVVIATGGNDEDVYVPPDSITTVGFTAQFRFRFVNTLGAPQPLITSASVRIYYIAMEAS